MSQSRDADTATSMLSPTWSRRLREYVFPRRRPHETETRFGIRLALYGPFLAFILLLVTMLFADVDGETGEGLILMYWLFIGVSQLIYVIPGVVLALLLKRPRIALGMIAGAGLIGVVDGLGWGIGLLRGVR